MLVVATQAPVSSIKRKAKSPEAVMCVVLMIVPPNVVLSLPQPGPHSYGPLYRRNVGAGGYRAGMKQPPSKRQLDVLGVALRAGETPDSAGLTELYAELMSFAAYALQDVQARVIEAVGVPARVTARVKTLDTMREKLVRLEHLRLANMDDLIGVRIVGDLTLVEQDAMAARIVQAFPGSRIKDRRAAPIAGYRAVHVIVDLGPIHAEIQIRTELQAAWADVFEATADRWGRGIRYGELVEPDPSGRADARADLIAILHTLSLDAIAGHEQMEQRHQSLMEGARWPRSWVVRIDAWRIRRMQAGLADRLWALIEKAATIIEQTP